MRKILIIIIILTAAAAGYYYFVMNKPAGEEQTAIKSKQTAELSVLIPEKTISPILSFSGETVWFFSGAGRLYRKPITPSLSPPYQGGDEEGVEEYLLPELIAETFAIRWQSDGSNFIVEQNLYGHSRYKFFDADKKVFIEYPEAVREPRFLSSAGKIVYDWVNAEGGHELTMADYHANNFEKLADLGGAEYRLETSPAQDLAVLYSDKPAEPAKLSIYDIKKRASEHVGDEAVYERVKFSPDGSKLLAVSDNSMAVYDLRSAEPPLFFKERGGVSSESPIIWKDSDNIVYAKETGIYQINIETSEEKTLYEFGSRKYETRDLLVHPEKPIIFFTNAETGYLHELEIKN